jgi:hypothetical protein
MTPAAHHPIAAAVCVAMARSVAQDRGRRRLAVVMLAVVLLTVGWVIVSGCSFPRAAFDFGGRSRSIGAC